jgi:hypothetical protein
MHFRKLTTAAAAAMMLAVPIAAQAAPAARASAPVSQESGLEGNEWVNALIIIAIAAAGMLALILSDDNDNPVSP